MLDTPAVVAGGSAVIRPNRFVKSAGENTVEECDANDEAIGVTTNSTLDYTSDNHAPATAGADVYLQGSVEKYVEAAESISAGDRVKSDADGKAVGVATSGTTTQNSPGIALQAASDGAIIKIKWQPVQFDPDAT